jgi:hypothetical protein
MLAVSLSGFDPKRTYGWLVELQAGLPDHDPPACVLLSNERAKLRWRARDRCKAQPFQSAPQARILQDHGNVAVQSLHDLRRRAGGGDKPDPGFPEDRGKTRFSDRRDVGQLTVANVSGHRECLERSGLDVFRDDQWGVNEQLDVAMSAIAGNPDISGDSIRRAEIGTSSAAAVGFRLFGSPVVQCGLSCC